MKQLSTGMESHLKLKQALAVKFAQVLFIGLSIVLASSSLLMAQDRITAEESESYGDRTVEEALIRLPGVYRNADGMINIRATGNQRFNLLIDGRPVANSTFSDRSYLLSGFTTDMYEYIELTKVLRPWMPADAIGGTINLRIRPEDSRAKRSGGALAGVDTQTSFGTYGSLGSRVGINYSHQLQDDLLIGGRAVYQSDSFGSEQLGIQYGAFDNGQGFEDALRSVSPALNITNNERLGAGLFMEYDPGERSSYYLSAYYHYAGSQADRHRQTFDGMGDWARPDSTGATGAQGFVMYDALTQASSLNQVDLQGGGVQRFDGGSLSYNINWSFADSHRDQLSLPFMRGGLNYDMDFDDRDRPVMNVTGVPVLENGTIDYRNMRFQGLTQEIGEYQDNTFAAGADLSLDAFNLKTGVSALLKFHDGFYEEARYSFFQPLDLYRFSMIPQGALEVFESQDYLIPWMLNTENARLFFEDSRPRFNRNENQLEAASAFRNFSHNEQVYAGYLSGGFDAGSFSLRAGLRAEMTIADYGGTSLTAAEDGSIEIREEVSAGQDYITLFPNAGIRWAPLATVDVELAYSRGINRPDFFQLSPFSLTNQQAGILFEGNPELEPAISDNLDLMINFNSGSSRFGLNLFYKQIQNLVFERSSIVDGGEFDGFAQCFFENSDNAAEITGMEVSAEHRFNYLPGLLSGFGISGSYTFTETSFEPDARPGETLRIPGHSPHILNASLFFEQGRLFTQFSAHHTAEAFSRIGDEPVLLPSVSGSPVFADSYNEGFTKLSYAVRFRISESFTFWGDASRNLSNKLTTFDDSRSLYPVSIEQNRGFTFRTGIRYQL